MTTSSHEVPETRHTPPVTSAEMGSRLEKNSESVRKRIEAHSFENEEGDEYEGSKFGGFADYFRRKKIKLQNLDAEVRSSSVGKPQIFKGIVAHVNGYTQPSLNDLHHLIVSHGGGFMQYLDGKTTVTHIIASNLTPRKAIEFRRYRIVKPAWIVDSVKSGKLLPWDSYRVLDEGAGQQLLGFDEGKIVSRVNTPQRGYRDQTNTSWYTSQVKNVVDDTDDEDGTQFPSTQVIALNGTGVYTDESADQPRQSIENVVSEEISNSNEIPSSSGSFAVSSSLEDAFNDAAAREGNRGKDSANLGLEIPRKAVYNSPVTPRTTPNRSTSTPIIENPSPDHNRSPSPHVNTSSGKCSRELESSSPSKKPKMLTAEEHNAILLADPHIRKSSTANPEFLKQYYSESRLHHLSTWKADLKSRFQQMASEKSASQKHSAKRKPGSRRYVMHVDFDSFFCAVSLKNAPEYIDKPAVVAHGSGTGSEIASCNYPARTFGVKNGMWMKSALKLCPNIKVLPYDFPAYEEASKRFYEAIIDVGGIVQSVSVDEALVDVTSLCLPAGGTDGFGIREGSIWREQEKADDIARLLRDRIKERTGCAVSIGIGGNILLAKVALRKAKPAGQHQIKPEEVLDFIAELSVRDLPGVAYSIGGKLEEIGVKLVKDVRQLTKDRLITVLGPKTGEKIWDYSRGIDKTEVGEQVVRKSISAEVNWGIRFISQPEAEEFVQNLCIELQRRLLDQRVKGRQFTMKIMKKAADAPLDPPKHLGHGKCDTFSKSIILGVATNNADIIGHEAISILRSYGFSPGELRGLGVQMTKLDPVKPFSDGFADGSQRRINFGVSAPPKLAKQITDDPIDDPVTPKKSKTTPSRGYETKLGGHGDLIDETVTPQKARSVGSWLTAKDDPIHDSPQKARATPVHPAAAISRANAADNSAKKFLNITGTQFIIPIQIDPEVLAELPQDIRSKILAQGRNRPLSRAESPVLKSRFHSPVREASNPPLPSQLDPEVFESLPEDMKAEILASYASNGPSARAQSLLPQSPPKVRSINAAKRITPQKKKRGRPPLFHGQKIKHDPNSSLTQSAFVANKKEASREGDTDSEGYTSDTLDPEFLSALPEDMRQEIIEEQRRKRLAKKGGLMTAVIPKKRRLPEALPPGQRKIRLPPKQPRPSFTTQELSTLPQLRDSLSAWFREFADDGPHPDDVAAMERYLKRVVLDERDMAKVTGVTKWIAWLIDDFNEDTRGKRAWSKALQGIKEKIQEAVQERGLGRLEL
ncbi:hypothetical protein G7Y89_g2594 [Cudoniella acicularis]|uniref:DNA repair protein REV1 n=1 Tax=Cudoniella acicularis TaxID=354080 RepID=A0A8H4RU60_9HELO|nr:hypothetical protein G7Y89_g2594 [Cudoniella acicularis]